MGTRLLIISSRSPLLILFWLFCFSLESSAQYQLSVIAPCLIFEQSLKLPARYPTTDRGYAVAGILLKRRAPRTCPSFNKPFAPLCITNVDPGSSYSQSLVLKSGALVPRLRRFRRSGGLTKQLARRASRAVWNVVLASVCASPRTSSEGDMAQVTYCAVWYRPASPQACARTAVHQTADNYESQVRRRP